MKTFVMNKVMLGDLIKKLWQRTVFDLVDVITGRKIFSELTREKNYYKTFTLQKIYLIKHFRPKDQSSLFWKNFIKGGKTKNLTWYVSAEYQLRPFKTNLDMFTAKNFRKVYIKHVYYLTKILDWNLEVNLLKMYMIMLSRKK